MPKLCAIDEDAVCCGIDLAEQHGLGRVCRTFYSPSVSAGRNRPLDPICLRVGLGVINDRYPARMEFDGVTVHPDRMGGMPCVRDLRFPVASVVAMVADGMTFEEILAEHPDLEADDISESLRFAALAFQERELPLLRPA